MGADSLGPTFVPLAGCFSLLARLLGDSESQPA